MVRSESAADMVVGVCIVKDEFGGWSRRFGALDLEGCVELEEMSFRLDAIDSKCNPGPELVELYQTCGRRKPRARCRVEAPLPRLVPLKRTIHG